MDEIEQAKRLLFNAELNACVSIEDRVIFLLTALKKPAWSLGVGS